MAAATTTELSAPTLGSTPSRSLPAAFPSSARARVVETKVESHNNSQNYQKKAEPREL